MKTKPRIPKNPKALAKKVVEYYFNNPNANSLKEMTDKFNVAHTRITKILKEEFKQRRENSITRKYMQYEFRN
tara:strand:+ start:158 stop:376 length:219 start_codon:yes stop_codon:yes gene_type:complete